MHLTSIHPFHLHLQITRVRSLLSHSAAVWDAAILPMRTAALMGLAETGQGSASSSALVTCSADGTLRLWSLGAEAGSAAPSSGTKGAPTHNYARTARTLRGVVRVGAEDDYMLGGQVEHSTISTGSTLSRQMCSPEAPLPVPGQGHGRAPGESAVQLRCLSISRDGLHLATGGQWHTIVKHCSVHIDTCPF
jgi:WD40 repeat protein